MNTPQIDLAILSSVGKNWTKVAMVIARVVDAVSRYLPPGDEGYELISERIKALVHDGRLASQGDIENWRFSEVRLKDDQASRKRRTVTLHVVSSLDGFIAKKDNTVSWMESPENAYEAGVSISEEEIAAFIKSIDCYVLGSRTYEHALELAWPYGDTPTVVITRRRLSSTKKNVEFYSGDLKALVEEKLAPRYRNIWLVGGAMLCQRFLELGLVDEIKLTIAPVLLGEGLRLFDGPVTEHRWNLKNVVAYKNGFVELSYTSVMA